MAEKEKNLLMPKGKTTAKGMGMPMGKPLQKGGKMKQGGLLRKAKETAEKVPTGPMGGLKF